MLSAESLLQEGQQRGVLLAGRGRVPSRTGRVGFVAASDESRGVLCAEDPREDGEQRGVLVPGGGRIARLPSPVGQVPPNG
jgi:hypothetical protein